MAKETKEDAFDNSYIIAMSKNETAKLATLLMAQLGDFTVPGHAKECPYLIVKDSDGRIKTLSFVLAAKTG